MNLTTTHTELQEIMHHIYCDRISSHSAQILMHKFSWNERKINGYAPWTYSSLAIPSTLLFLSCFHTPPPKLFLLITLPRGPNPPTASLFPHSPPLLLPWFSPFSLFSPQIPLVNPYILLIFPYFFPYSYPFSLLLPLLLHHSSSVSAILCSPSISYLVTCFIPLSLVFRAIPHEKM